MNHSRKALMLPLVASVLLMLAPNCVLLQSTESTTASSAASSTTSVTTVASVTLENTTVDEPTTSTITTPSPVTSTNTASTVTSSTPSPSPSSSSTPEGAANSPCNATVDCQPNQNLECMEGVCHCSQPLVFDVRVERCVIPLGKQCDSSDILGESMCPEFAECFMDRCVCKTGYSMHTLTRCKSDLAGPNDERKPLLLWPRQAAKSKQDASSSDEKGSCTSETCDASKGLVCQEETCICKDSKEIFVEEFGRCLNTTMQKTLKDALSIVSTSEDEIKSFVKLLEKFDDADQEIGGSDHYNSPVHQLLGLLGGGEYRDGGPTHSQLAQPYSSYRGEGDLHSAAQEPVTETALPSDGSNASGGSSGGETSGSRGGPAETIVPAHDSHNNHHLSPAHAAHAESAESGEAMHYHSESQESIKKPEPAYPSRSLALDNLQYSPQSQEPQIVQRQAPPYLQGEGIPLQGLGTIPGGNHFRLPIQGLGGYGQFGGQFGLGGLGGLGGHDGGYGQGLQGLGGYGGGHQGYGGGPQSFGGGGQQGHDQHGAAQGGFGGGGGSGQHGGELLHLGRGQHPPPHGGFGGMPGGFGGHGMPGPPGGGHGGPPGQSGLLVDVAEFVGRSLKLIDRFLPLVHAINDVLKKEKVFGGLAGLGGGGGPGGPDGHPPGPEGPRGRRFGDISKEIDELKDGGDGTLKKLLA